MGSLERRIEAFERRAGDPQRVRVRFFDAGGCELGMDGPPTGRTLADFMPDPGAITVRMDFSADREAEK